MRLSVPQRKTPVTTITVLAITATVTTIGLWSPTVLLALKREPDELAGGQYWRLFTSLLVQNHDWRQIVFNFCALLVAGTLVERRVSPMNWLGLYVSAGVVGQIAGVFWKPTGAGNSVATCGLVGAITVWMLAAQRTQLKVGGAVLLTGALLLVLLRDLHGPPLLLGAFATFLSDLKANVRE
jgi:rhomboid protease GluP